jgi:gliding motility-associated-like protein
VAKTIRSEQLVRQFCYRRRTYCGFGGTNGAGVKQIDLTTGDPLGLVAWDGSGNEALYYTVQTPNGFLLSDHSWTPGNGTQIAQWTRLTNTNFETIWSKAYFLTGLNIRGRTFLANNGDGYWMVPYDNFDSGAADGYLVRLNADGSVRWARKYGGADADRLIDGIQMPDGGFLLVGHTDSYTTNNRQMWVVRTNADGEVEGQCTQDIELEVVDYNPSLSTVVEQEFDAQIVNTESTYQIQNPTLVAVLVPDAGGDIPLELPTQTQLCPNQSVTLNNAGVVDGTVFQWVAVPPDPTLGTSAGNPTVLPMQNTTYYVKAVLGSCVRYDSVSIELLNAALNTSPDTIVCPNQSTMLSATGSLPGTYAWSDGQSDTPITVAPTTTTTYSVTYTYGPGCTATSSVEVQVENFEVSLSIDPTDSPVTIGQVLNLSATVEPPGTDYQFDWSTCAVVDSPDAATTAATVPNTTDPTVSYCVVVTSPTGCTLTESILRAIPPPTVEVPNAFTPDNDQLNDTFGPVVLGEQSLLSVLQMDVYNRWGQVVFSSTPQQVRWDGQVNGQPAPPDVYVYRLQYRLGNNPISELMTGNVTLLR